jgi:capsular exopolysaccharide synthesis family protein
MSRIDQALRNWESAKGAVTPQGVAVDQAVATALADYPTERATQPVERVEPIARQEPVAEPVVEPRPSQSADTRPRDNAYLAARLVTGGVGSVPLEQYRRLAAVLHEAQVQGNLKTVMVTSALPGEGKSLTVANLAHTLSGSYGRRVLVIDADLRAPNVHRIFGVRNSGGLGDALRTGRRELPFVHISDGLTVLTAGRPGPAPLADLISDRMGDIIRESASSFDWVLIDTPPVGLLSDAQVLARLAGAVVFVIAAGSTPRSAVERAVAELGPDSIIGSVLNRVEDRRIPEANYYDDYYGQDGSSGD